mgnify:CR=1 FL=1
MCAINPLAVVETILDFVVGLNQCVEHRNDSRFGFLFTKLINHRICNVSLRFDVQFGAIGTQIRVAK